MQPPFPKLLWRKEKGGNLLAKKLRLPGGRWTFWQVIEIWSENSKNFQTSHFSFWILFSAFNNFFSHLPLDLAKYWYLSPCCQTPFGYFRVGILSHILPERGFGKDQLTIWILSGWRLGQSYFWNRFLLISLTRCASVLFVIVADHNRHRCLDLWLHADIQHIAEF